MSEEPGVYMELKFALKALDDRLQAINTDPTASHWLKRAVTELWERDVVDALNDVAALREVLEAKHLSALAESSLMVEDDTSIQETHIDDIMSGSANKLWVAGWMWGKYPEHAPSEAHLLPQDETEAVEWLDGFRWGATEAYQFHQLWDWLDETLAGHDDAIALVKRVGATDEL